MSFATRSPARSRGTSRALALLSLPLFVACTFYHSKQALYAHAPSAEAASADAHFITEEDSGLAIFGVFVLAEPDHYAVLLERMRRDYRCSRLLYPQLDFYTDHWLLIAFPISRVTSLCEPEPAEIPALPGRPGWHDPPASGPAPSDRAATPTAQPVPRP